MKTEAEVGGMQSHELRSTHSLQKLAKAMEQTFLEPPEKMQPFLHLDVSLMKAISDFLPSEL